MLGKVHQRSTTNAIPRVDAHRWPSLSESGGYREVPYQNSEIARVYERPEEDNQQFPSLPHFHHYSM